ncbi:MAG: molybdenum ABC transporter ATP-binding protein [Pseudomonadota bacterium]
MSDRRLQIAARRTFPDIRLDIDADWRLAKRTGLFGPSGAGKSTLLRLIAGLDRPDEGRIVFNDDVWCDTAERRFTPPHRRPVGVMFQEGRLFPHLTVEQNLLYADRRCSTDNRRFEMAEIIDAFDLQPLLARRPQTLSGGERQRAALARTLLTRPRLLLLDEPLSALDRARKAEILPYLDDLSDRFDTAVLYVSHSVDEILRFADETILLDCGRVAGFGPTADALAASDDGAAGAASAIIAGVVTEHDARLGLTRVAVGGGDIALPLNVRLCAGDTATMRIDPRNVAIATAPPDHLSIQNALAASIADIAEQADTPFAIVTLRAGDVALRAQVTRAAVETLDLKTGGAVFALIKSASFDL